LALSNAKLFPILRRLAAVRHVGTIRIHSRAVSVAPGRIDDELLRFLGESGKYCYYAHMNHPDDLLHPDVLQAVNRLRLAGIPVFNQCVLLRGVNDDIATIRKLMLACYAAKVFPYNLYLLDRVAGVAHFEVDQVTVKAIFDSLEDLPGPAQPVFVLVDRHNRKQRAIPSGDFDLFSFLRHGS
jgi:glycine amidinotransferase